MKLFQYGTLSIILSALIAFILSMTGNMEGAGLGGLFNLLIPPLAGLIAVIVFLVICAITKDKTYRTWTLIFCCLYLLYAGIILHSKQGFLPFPF